ncbi:MAG TPA: LuxR family transcriptional regulator [Albitalea sp.]|uniref:LuxR family transcriptional regulator n=1 Tax=Piscinibacter sp. TaxID=1903157 RepID=UPI002ED49C83
MQAADASDRLSGLVLLFDEPPALPAAERPPAVTQPALLAEMLRADGPASRRQIVGAALRRIGYDGLTYGRMSFVRGDAVPTAFCVSHGDCEWVRRYFARRYHSVDPRLRSVIRSSLPYRWSVKALLRTATTGRKGESVRKFLDAMRDSGMRSGVMLALPGPHADERSIVSMSSRHADDPPDDDGHTAQVLMLAICLHEFYGRYVQWPQDEAVVRPELTARQNQILDGLARGWTDREIAESLSMSMHGVDYHLRRLRECFNARNRVELVQAAFHARSP